MARWVSTPPAAAVLGWLALVLFLPHCAPRADGAEAAGTSMLGQQVYDEHCASCHDGVAVRVPTREALATFSAEAVQAALAVGTMREHGAKLSPDERRAVSVFLGAGGAAHSEPAPSRTCGRSAPPPNLDAGVFASGWDLDPRNTRLQPAARAGLVAGRIASLRLAWAFGFPGANKARSLPAVAGDTLFVGAQDGNVYALDRRTGCERWRYRAESEVRSALAVGAPAAGEPERVYFGDFGGSIYALDARTGDPQWRVRPHPHPHATITGSLRLHDGRVYVPISSYEVAVAMNPLHACCTFRGAVVVLDAETGAEVWTSFTVPEPKPRGRNALFAKQFGPSGAPVWTSPAIDEKRGLVYVATGENYSTPASAGSDAVFAFDLATGAVRWVRQTTPGDAYTMACHLPGRVNCPAEDGPDFDFGGSPVLVDLGDGRDRVVAGQKSGVVFGLEPESGAIVWRTRMGRGGTLGGIHWGLAAEGRRVYVPVSDRPDGRTYPDPAQPGLAALDAESGALLWRVPAPDTCAGAASCFRAFSAAPSAIEGAVFAGGLDGRIRAYAGASGTLLWEFDTRRSFSTVNGVKARGGAIDSAGALIADRWVYVNSGYGQFDQLSGNVLLAFAPASEAVE